MGTEQILKLQPDRTLYLRGFTGVGAAAALCQTSPTGFTVRGVFRDMADFCVLNVYDADNTFEHYTVRYLPDFNLKGMVLSFDVAYQGLQPLDSAKYSWIDWAALDVIREDGTPANIRLWEHAQLVSANYSVASGTCQFTTGPQGCAVGDQLTLFVNNVSFPFQAQSPQTAEQVAGYFRDRINTFDWSTFQSHSISVIASTDGNGALTLKNARTGRVIVLGNQVRLMSDIPDLPPGIPFAGIAAGSTIYIDGAAHTVASVDSPTTLTLTDSVGVVSNKPYLAEYGGVDGNSISAYFVGPSSTTLSVDKTVINLSGGNSDNVVWRVTIDFTALEIDQVRQAWITFAPQLAGQGVYQDTEWTATFSNWSVADPNSIRPFRSATPASVRIGNDENRSCQYSGSGWTSLAANNYWHGFAQATANPGDSLTINYSAGSTHDLYLGTSLCPARGQIGVSLDGDDSTTLDCWIQVDSELVTRRLLRGAVPPGQHTLTLTLLETKNAEWNKDFNPYQFVFDYLEAAVLGDFFDAPEIYDNVSPALDYDTDATYKVSPQRLLWHLQKLGFRGQLNEYLGVFWWNQRQRVSSYHGHEMSWTSADVIFSGNWNPGEVATLRIGANAAAVPPTSGFAPQKVVTAWDTLATIGAHFVYYINSASVAMWAEDLGNGHIVIHSRTPFWSDTLDSGSPSDSRISLPNAINPNGVDGTWVIDPSAANPINFGARAWHADLFQEVKNAGLQITAAFSMELVNPPDDDAPGNEWFARGAHGKAITTATGFNKLFSSHCAPTPNLTAYQKAAYQTLAGLQADASLTPWLQFGEFLWWFFSSVAQSIGYCSYTDPINIGLGEAHGMQTGDQVIISGVVGCPAANGSWSVTVTDDTHFTIPASADGPWQSGTGFVRGGSMAFYDASTTAAAQQVLGRPLARFTFQDDDPSLNGGADVAFLAAHLKAHVDAIRNAVLAAYPQAKFELLYPCDVNHPTAYFGSESLNPQGGRLNAAVNLPPEWTGKATSGFDRFKAEALSWSSQYTNLTLATEAMSFPVTSPMTWSMQDTAYLVPWFNGICAWPAEYQLAKNIAGLINFWAYDHLALMSWPLPFPTHNRRATFMG